MLTLTLGMSVRSIDVSSSQINHVKYNIEGVKGRKSIDFRSVVGR